MKSNCALLFFKNTIHTINRTSGLVIIILLRKGFISNPYIIFILIFVFLNSIISDSGIIIIIFLRKVFIINPYIIYILVFVVLNIIISDSGITIIFTYLFVTLYCFMIFNYLSFESIFSACLYHYLYIFYIVVNGVLLFCILIITTTSYAVFIVVF